MSDVYIPGIQSRFDTDKLIEGLMSVERLPKERTERNIGALETQKGYWQEIGRRISSLRDGARSLYSFQNPFTERVARSADDQVITAAATREAGEREYHFTVKQVAQADRFLSRPLEDSFRVDPGTYAFSVGENEISFDFRGGTLKEFTDLINRRGQGRLGASLIAVERGAKALLIESKVTGAKNRLGFSGDSEKLAYSTGMAERLNDSRREVPFQEDTLTYISDRQYINLEESLSVYAGGAVSVPVNPGVQARAPWVIQFETLTSLLPEDAWTEPPPPPGPEIPPAGEVSYGGVTIENDPASTPLPSWTPPSPPRRVDDLSMLSLVFSDGSKVPLPPVNDSPGFVTTRYDLDGIAGGRVLRALEINNGNTHRDLSIRNVQIFNPEALGGFRPRNPVSTAQDALITMEGIEIQRDTNTIDDLIPGVTLNVRGISSRPVNLGIEPDRESVKDSIITLVGNYNRLMAEMNVLTRTDARILDELSYLSEEERQTMRGRLGAFSGDTVLNQFKNSMQRAASMPYRTSGEEQDYILLAQIGISTDARRAGLGGGYDPARLRGYLEIDEKVLDAALETKLPMIQQLFGYDTDGDLIVDSGLGLTIENLSRPYVESGGFISLKTGALDSRISQDRRRIETMDRQLAAREAQLKMQYSQMEGAYNRMEQLSTSLESFSRQNSGNDNR
jgi:flagellar hook-associated protein 2